MSALFPVLYGVLVLALSIPRSVFSRGDGAVSPGARSVAAFVCAFASTYALPWSGVPMIPSQAWFPVCAAAILLVPAHDGQRRLPILRSGKVAALLCLSLFYTGMANFMLRVGTPGALGSIEGMSAAFRLESLGYGLLAAQAVFFGGMAVAFAATGLREGAPASMTLFSCAGFLTTAFLSPLFSKAAIATGAAQPVSIAVQIVSALIVSALLAMIFRRTQGLTAKIPAASFTASTILTVAGCVALRFL